MTDPGSALLLARGAARWSHPGGTLAAHLARVGARLARHEAHPAVIRAGRCHAAYGTAGYPVALLGLPERPLLEQRIGPAAETHVYLYCAMDRTNTEELISATTTVVVRDRFTGGSVVLSPDEVRAQRALHVANELDVWDHAHLTVEQREALRRLLWSAVAHCGGDPAADDILRTTSEGAGPEPGEAVRWL